VAAADAVAVAVEDSANGVRAAVDAGLRCIAVPNAVTHRHDVSGAYASTSPGELLAYLG
jgi:beta-phosphoglucomutase-like phosphatase (HAD superfamily)